MGTLILMWQFMLNGSMHTARARTSNCQNTKIKVHTNVPSIRLKMHVIQYLTVLMLLVSSLANDNTPPNLLDTWSGKWFPVDPNSPAAAPIPAKVEVPMGIPNANCDNAKDNLEKDFDPNNVTHRVAFMCLSDKRMFKPNYDNEPIIKESIIPPAYKSLHKCMNTSIEYEERIPTFGMHRPLWPMYGDYIYVPPQRWVHIIEHGSIVMLYHPCANYNQIEKLKMLVKNCLYRHLITPSSRLLAERPLALVAWGRSLEMSVVDRETVIKFITQSALRGPEKVSTNGKYGELITNAAKIVSDVNDSIVCPNNV